MRRFHVRLHERELDKEEREEGENGGLQCAYKYLEHHQRYRQEVRREVDGDRNDDFTGQYVPKEPERERDDSHEFTDELDKANGRPYRIAKWIYKEFAAVFPHAYRSNTRKFNDKKRDNREREWHSEVCRRRA